MSLQHAEVDVGAFMLEDTLMLFALKVDLSTAASMVSAMRPFRRACHPCLS